MFYHQNNSPVVPSNPPTAYKQLFMTAAPSVDLRASIIGPLDHVSLTGSYFSTLLTRREPLKPPTAHIQPYTELVSTRCLIKIVQQSHTNDQS